MSKTRTISATVLLAIGLIGSAVLAPNSGAEATQTEADYEITDPAHIAMWNETDNDQPVAIVDWAVERYGLAGLALPDSEIHFHPFEPSKQDCSGYGGYYTARDGNLRIDMCAVGVPSRRRILLHELAHAWAHEHLSDDQRQAFVADRGLAAWNDRGADWDERATEHAAEIITWGLDSRCKPHEMIENDAASLEAAFVLLTGVSPVCQPVNG